MQTALAGQKVLCKAPRQQVAGRRQLRVQAYKVTFIRDGKERTCEVGPNDYMLDAADANRIELNASCRGGVCGTCVSKLVSGTVDNEWLEVLDDGNVLSKEQIAAGYILPCSAKPTSDCVVEANSDWGVHTIEKWSHTARA